MVLAVTATALLSHVSKGQTSTQILYQRVLTDLRGGEADGRGRERQLTADYAAPPPRRKQRRAKDVRVFPSFLKTMN